jgi:tetratricopeptide (TPR) repeat protein
MAIIVIVLLPVLGLVPFDFQTYSTVADHYLYLAMLGPALIVAWLVSRRPSTPIVIVVACLVAGLGVRTFFQTAHWRDTASLFTHGLDVNPRSFASYNSLAALAIEKDDPQRAIQLAQSALAIRKSAVGYHTYGEALRRLGRTDDAVAAFRAALRQEPDYVPSLANLAAMLAEQGRLDEAIPLARRAVEADPHSVPNRMNLALMYLNSNQPNLARPHLEAVLRLDPNNATARELSK